jgi:dTDP-4-dehydrorhamnose reductase
MKILLLGHKGMLGSDLLLRFSPAHEVIGMDREEIDIVSPSQCREAIEATSPDVVVNAAAFTNVDACETEPEEAFAVNAQAVRNLAVACDKRKIPFVHFSTDYVFDGQARSPYREDDACNPLNVYGASKRQGEQYLQAATDRYLLIRTSWLFGLKGENFVEAILEKAEAKNFIHQSMKYKKTAASKSSTLEVVDDQEGCPTYTKDLAAAVDLLIQCGARGVFHVTNRGKCTWHQFAVQILKEAGFEKIKVIPIKSDRLERPARRPLYSVLSNQKFFQTTGKAMQPWQLALQDYLKNRRR